MNHRKIKVVSYCCLLVLIGCGEEPNMQDERPLPVSITTREMIIEWNKMFQSATEQFTGKLNEVSNQVLSEFKTQADSAFKKLEEAKKIQTVLDKKGSTKELNEVIQKTTEQFTGKLNEVSNQVLSEFKTQADSAFKKLEEAKKIQTVLDKKGSTKELNEVIQKTTEQFTEKLDEVSNQVLSEFRTQADSAFKKLEEARKAQTVLDKEDSTKELNEVIQKTTEQFAGKLDEVSNQVLSEFKTQAEAVLKKVGEREATQIHLAEENMTKEVNEVIQTAITQFNTELSTVLSTERDNIITEMNRVTQTATADVTASVTAALNRFRRELLEQFQETAATPEPESPDPITKIMEEARPVIRDIVSNSELFVDFEVKEIVQRTIKILNIQWIEITTEEDKEELADQIINTIYNSGRKHTVRNVHSALMDNIRQSVQNITTITEEIVDLKEVEKMRVTSKIQSETEKAIKRFIDERIRQAVGQTIDTETAEQAVYILQFDVENTPLHRHFGKPINLFVFLKRQEEAETFPLSNKGDCVKIKKEYLSSVTLVLQYTNPVVGMNFPSSMIEFCNPTDKFKCQAGHYDIQRMGEGQGIDYVLKWRKTQATDQPLSCPEFPGK